MVVDARYIMQPSGYRSDGREDMQIDAHHIDGWTGQSLVMVLFPSYRSSIVDYVIANQDS